MDLDDSNSTTTSSSSSSDCAKQEQKSNLTTDELDVKDITINVPVDIRFIESTSTQTKTLEIGLKYIDKSERTRTF